MQNLLWVGNMPISKGISPGPEFRIGAECLTERDKLPLVVVCIARILKNAYMIRWSFRIKIGRVFLHLSCFEPRDLGST